jgi:phosphotransferase system IIB component
MNIQARIDRLKIELADLSKIHDEQIEQNKLMNKVFQEQVAQNQARFQQINGAIAELEQLKGEARSNGEHD